MVGGGLVSHQSEARSQRARFAARVGSGQLSNCVDDVAPIQARHGAYRARAPQGVVEIDETYIAITDRENATPALLRKSHTDKIIIGLAVEILQPKGFGRIRLRQLSNDSKESVRQFIQDSIEPNSTVRTDGSGSYAKLYELGYHHERTVMLGSEIPAHVSMVGVHRVASLLKRWILGTHHGSIQPVHLDAYLEEFVFRFNRRASGSRGMLFYRLLQQAVATDPVTYQDIIHPGLERGKAA